MEICLDQSLRHLSALCGLIIPTPKRLDLKWNVIKRERFRVFVFVAFMPVVVWSTISNYEKKVAEIGKCIYGRALIGRLVGHLVFLELARISVRMKREADR